MKDCQLASVGFPKRSAKIFSEEVWTGSRTGPHWNEPAKAPAEVETAGTIEEKSFSTTATPGLSWKGIVILLITFTCYSFALKSTNFIVLFIKNGILEVVYGLLLVWRSVIKKAKWG
jgi:hypothetical protein